jgi:hypothetical protein
MPYNNGFWANTWRTAADRAGLAAITQVGGGAWAGFAATSGPQGYILGVTASLQTSLNTLTV